MSSNLSGALVKRPLSTLHGCVTSAILHKASITRHRSIFLYQEALGQNGDEDPCKAVVCPRGQMCMPVMNSGVKATICQCPRTCPAESENEPVCSYYNRQFNSRCEMYKYACAHDLTMKVKNQGNCPSASKHDSYYESHAILACVNGERVLVAKKHEEEPPIPRLFTPMSPTAYVCFAVGQVTPGVAGCWLTLFWLPVAHQNQKQVLFWLL